MMPAVPTIRTCSNCRFCDRKREDVFACRALPPEAHVIPWPKSSIVGAVQKYGIKTVYTIPIVDPNGWCGLHAFPSEEETLLHQETENAN